MHHSTEPGSLFLPLICTKIWYHSTNIGGSESSSPDKLRMPEDLCFLSWKSKQVWGEFVYKYVLLFPRYIYHTILKFAKKETIFLNIKWTSKWLKARNTDINSYLPSSFCCQNCMNERTSLKSHHLSCIQKRLKKTHCTCSFESSLESHSQPTTKKTTNFW